MSITSITTSRKNTTTQVTVVSSLTPPVYFFWYLDGAYVGMTQNTTRTFVLPANQTYQLSVLDSTDPDFDPIANAPPGYPSTRTLFFIRSLDAGISQYRIEQSEAGGAWTPLAFIADDPSVWQYQYQTDQLDDLNNYAWRVVVMDAIGNDGSIVTLGNEFILRNPDPPNFSITLESGPEIKFALVA